jgi:hypothetical protein
MRVSLRICASFGFPVAPFRAFQISKIVAFVSCKSMFENQSANHLTPKLQIEVPELQRMNSMNSGFANIQRLGQSVVPQVQSNVGINLSRIVHLGVRFSKTKLIYLDSRLWKT